MSKTLAVDMVDLAAGAGVDRRTVESARGAIAQGDSRLAEGNYGGAAQAYGEGLGIASDSVHFDLDRFEHHLRNKMVLWTIGAAYTINVDGKLARSGHHGYARMPTDPPETFQSPDT